MHDGRSDFDRAAMGADDADGETVSEVSDTPIRRAVGAVVEDVIDRRSRGETVSDTDVVALHADLLPDLSDALRRLHVIERARARASELTAAEEIFEELGSSEKLRVDGYDVLREITTGGQSRVYLARQQQTGDLVALKMVRNGTAAERAQLERFDREIEAMSTLRHPNIVPILSHGIARSGERFLVMPYVEGADLSPADLAQSHSLDARLVMFRIICEAVAAAHRVGTIHRDLKPTNIRVDSAGVPHVLDFGLARIAHADEPKNLRRSITVTGQFVGTMMWSSPEQLAGISESTPAADVYSLGVILHQLVAHGAHPIQVFDNLQSAAGSKRDDSSIARMALRAASIATRTTSTTSKTRRKVSRAVRRQRSESIEPDARPLGSLIDRALSTAPADRPANAIDLLREFDEAVARSQRTMRRRIAALKRSRIAHVCALIGTLMIAGAVLNLIAHRIEQKNHRPLLVNGRPLDVIGSPVSMELVWIPSGEFEMGSGRDEPRIQDETRHRVIISRGYYMASTETPQKLYQDVMGTNPSRFIGADLPVEQVSWFDAMEFCERLSKRTGRHVRLPTEAEWEYACRAGTTTRFCSGEASADLVRYANLADLSCPANVSSREPFDDGAPFTRSVTGGLANEWHLLNMHGNVCEWCGDEYKPYPKNQGNVLVDQGREGIAKSTTKQFLNSRGGSWWDDSNNVRSAARNPLGPTLKIDTVGFRFVVDE